MKTEKEKWIEEIVSYSEGIAPAEANRELWAGIQARLSHTLRQRHTVSPGAVWLAAASLALLVVLNVAVVSQNSSLPAATAVPHQASQSPYALTGSFNLY